MPAIGHSYLRAANTQAIKLIIFNPRKVGMKYVTD